ncbi:glycerophosphodiester phosphodiesterase [Clostridium culturomicium]|uniref:glycerophosphodiester phosphodiesterase n=1 Tax=Clostridium culturomicium TaxID=1499683 RepID=UPI000590D5DB|nr:glycerophosphodiester phosphodiesterase family protein [Clostridium culturomicium]
MIYFAHRGLSEIYPENTILSFDKAMTAGAEAVEFDVHKTKDGELVVIHDEDIKRTFNGSGLIKDFTLAELKNFKCKNPEFENSKLCKLPTLNEVLEILKSGNLFINIELKTDLIHYNNIEADVLATIKKYNLQNKVLISSFNPQSLEILRELDDLIKLGVLFGNNKMTMLDFALKVNAYSINPDVYLVDQALINFAHDNELKVFSYTVNKPSVASNLEKLGCDGIFTDNILKFKKD